MVPRNGRGGFGSTSPPAGGWVPAFGCARLSWAWASRPEAASQPSRALAASTAAAVRIVRVFMTPPPTTGKELGRARTRPACGREGRYRRHFSSRATGHHDVYRTLYARVQEAAAGARLVALPTLPLEGGDKEATPGGPALIAELHTKAGWHYSKKSPGAARNCCRVVTG